MKKIIFAFILGGILFGSIAVIAVNEINANQITYTKNGIDTTVDAALNELYENVSITEAVRIGTYNNTSSITFTPLSEYKYFILTDVTWHASQAIYNNLVSINSITNITNATYIKTGEAGANYTKQSGATCSYIIIPDGSGSDITITTAANAANVDGASLYGIK